MKLHVHPPDVVIAGAGPVGLFAALSLLRHQVPVRIIDKAPGPGVHSYALALHPKSLDLLAALGLDNAVLRFAHRIDRLAIYADHRRVAEVDFGTLPGLHRFIAVLPQSALESILIEALARQGTAVEWNHRLATMHLEPDEVSGSIERRAQHMMGYATSHMDWMVDQVRPFHVPYLIGADGHDAITRALAQIPLVPAGPARIFAFFEFETSEPLEPEVRLVFAEGTVNVCWPLSRHRCRWSFELSSTNGFRDDREKQRSYLQLGDRHYQLVNSERIQEMLAHRAPFFKTTIRRVDWRLMVRFEQALAEYFTEGNLALIGDAAHLAHPVGAQSMNQGLLEADGLSEALARILLDGGVHDGLEAWGLRARAEWTRLQSWRDHLSLSEDGDSRLEPYLSQLADCLPGHTDGLPALFRQLGVAAPGVTSPSASSGAA